MSDVNTDTQAPYVEPRTGQEFAILSFTSDLGKIGAHLKAQKIRETQDFFRNRKDLAAQVDWQRLLVEIESTPVTVHHILQYVQSPEGAAKAIELSLAKAGVNGTTPQHIFEELGPVDLVNIALIVTRGVPRPVPEPRIDNPLSSGSDSQEPPPSPSAGRKRKRQTSDSSSTA